MKITVLTFLVKKIKLSVLGCLFFENMPKQTLNQIS